MFDPKRFLVTNSQSGRTMFEAIAGRGQVAPAENASIASPTLDALRNRH